ncbi:MAG: magnesium/cobalt transporter CorA [Gemmataceae bacterium]
MLRIFRRNHVARSCGWLEPAEILGKIDELRDTADLLWIDLDQPTEDEEKLVFDGLVHIHTLSREDVTRERRDPEHHPHLPKVEQFPDYLLAIVNPLHPELLERMRRPKPGACTRGPVVTQLSGVLTRSRLVTYHVEPLASVSKLRSYLARHEEHADRGPDYLFHLILDEMVDEYVPILDHFTDSLDAMEEQIFRRPGKASLPRLLHMKRDIIALRKTLVHERELLARLSRGEFDLIDDRETVYYRNVYDHVVRFAELVESSREMVSDLMESHLSATSNHLNEIMKVLTMISTVILPMTLVAGIYGMNFDRLPGKDWFIGFEISLVLMLLSGVLPFAFFRWRRWL